MQTPKKCSNCLERPARGYVHTFLGRQGELHIHRDNPFGKTVPFREEGQEYAIVGHGENEEPILAPVPAENLVFELWLGGRWWNRQCRCVGRKIDWEIVSARNGNLLLRSKTDGVLVGFSIFSEKANEMFAFLSSDLGYLSWIRQAAIGLANRKLLEDLVEFIRTDLRPDEAGRKFAKKLQTDALPFTPLTTTLVPFCQKPFPGLSAVWQHILTKIKVPVLAKEMTPVVEK